jgi:hypothetical protein
MDGRVFRAPISSTGAFQLVLPVGGRYTVRFANTTSNPSLYDSFAVLAVRPGQHVINWTAGASVSLGHVGGGGVQPATLQSLSEPEDDSAEASDDDANESAEDDGAEACDVSGGSSETEVESEYDLQTQVGADTDADEKEMEDEHDQACASMTGTTPSP